MKSIEEMIKELCPEGVEKVKIKEVYKRLKGTPITAGVMKEIEEVDGDTIIFAGGKTIIRAFENRIPKGNIIKVPSVVVQSRGVIDFQYCETPFTFKNEMWAYTHDNPRCTKYLYYFLKTQVNKLRIKGSEHGSMPQISLAATEELEIPLPPLPIQQQIADTLDKFTSLISNLDKEIELRQKQYEYYREKLLTFNEGECEWKTISEVADNYTGLTYKPDNVSEVGTIVLRSSNIKENTIAFDDNVYVKDINIPRRAITQEGDILICVRNGSRALIGKCAMIPKTDKDMAFGAFMTILRATNINNKYLFYAWQLDKSVKQYKGDDAMPINQITSKDFKHITIPVPPLPRQREIVSTLDKFEAVLANLKRERELRQKQYEYYREKLLTF